MSGEEEGREKHADEHAANMDKYKAALRNIEDGVNTNKVNNPSIRSGRRKEGKMPHRP